MVILVDLNIILDFLLTREPFYQASATVMEICAKGNVKGYLAFHSISNLWYILRKVPEDRRRACLAELCDCLQVAGASHQEVVKAIKMEHFKDFEDCLQDRCAKSIDADYIITRNIDDFVNSDVPALLPEKFLEYMELYKQN